MATVTVEDIETLEPEAAEAPLEQKATEPTPPPEKATEPPPETATEEEEPPKKKRVTVEEPAPAPKRRGRPKVEPKAAAPKAEPKAAAPKPEPKPRGRPRKQPEESAAAPLQPPTDEQLRDYLGPLLHAYAAHAHLRGREAKRAHYRELFSRAI